MDPQGVVKNQRETTGSGQSQMETTRSGQTKWKPHSVAKQIETT